MSHNMFSVHLMVRIVCNINFHQFTLHATEDHNSIPHRAAVNHCQQLVGFAFNSVNINLRNKCKKLFP